MASSTTPFAAFPSPARPSAAFANPYAEPEEAFDDWVSGIEHKILEALHPKRARLALEPPLPAEAFTPRKTVMTKSPGFRLYPALPLAAPPPQTGEGEGAVNEEWPLPAALGGSPSRDGGRERLNEREEMDVDEEEEQEKRTRESASREDSIEEIVPRVGTPLASTAAAVAAFESDSDDEEDDRDEEEEDDDEAELEGDYDEEDVFLSDGVPPTASQLSRPAEDAPPRFKSALELLSSPMRGESEAATEEDDFYDENQEEEEEDPRAQGGQQVDDGEDSDVIELVDSEDEEEEERQTRVAVNALGGRPMKPIGAPYIDDEVEEDEYDEDEVDELEYSVEEEEEEQEGDENESATRSVTPPHFVPQTQAGHDEPSSPAIEVDGEEEEAEGEGESVHDVFARFLTTVAAEAAAADAAEASAAASAVAAESSASTSPPAVISTSIISSRLMIPPHSHMTIEETAVSATVATASQPSISFLDEAILDSSLLQGEGVDLALDQLQREVPGQGQHQQDEETIEVVQRDGDLVLASEEEEQRKGEQAKDTESMPEDGGEISSECDDDDDDDDDVPALGVVDQRQPDTENVNGVVEELAEDASRPLRPLGPVDEDNDAGINRDEESDDGIQIVEMDDDNNTPGGIDITRSVDVGMSSGTASPAVHVAPGLTAFVPESFRVTATSAPPLAGTTASLEPSLPKQPSTASQLPTASELAKPEIRHALTPPPPPTSSVWQTAPPLEAAGEPSVPAPAMSDIALEQRQLTQGAPHPSRAFVLESPMEVEAIVSDPFEWPSAPPPSAAAAVLGRPQDHEEEESDEEDDHDDDDDDIQIQGVEEDVVSLRPAQQKEPSAEPSVVTDKTPTVIVGDDEYEREHDAAISPHPLLHHPHHHHLSSAAVDLEESEEKEESSSSKVHMAPAPGAEDIVFHLPEHSRETEPEPEQKTRTLVDLADDDEYEREHEQAVQPLGAASASEIDVKTGEEEQELNVLDSRPHMVPAPGAEDIHFHLPERREDPDEEVKKTIAAEREEDEFEEEHESAIQPHARPPHFTVEVEDSNEENMETSSKIGPAPGGEDIHYEPPMAVKVLKEKYDKQDAPPVRSPVKQVHFEEVDDASDSTLESSAPEFQPDVAAMEREERSQKVLDALADIRDRAREEARDAVLVEDDSAMEVEEEVPPTNAEDFIGFSDSIDSRDVSPGLRPEQESREGSPLYFPPSSEDMVDETEDDAIEQQESMRLDAPQSVSQAAAPAATPLTGFQFGQAVSSPARSAFQGVSRLGVWNPNTPPKFASSLAEARKGAAESPSTPKAQGKVRSVDELPDPSVAPPPTSLRTPTVPHAKESMQVELSIKPTKAPSGGVAAVTSLPDPRATPPPTDLEVPQVPHIEDKEPSLVVEPPSTRPASPASSDGSTMQSSMTAGIGSPGTEELQPRLPPPSPQPISSIPAYVEPLGFNADVISPLPTPDLIESQLDPMLSAALIENADLPDPTLAPPPTTLDTPVVVRELSLPELSVYSDPGDSRAPSPIHTIDINEHEDRRVPFDTSHTVPDLGKTTVSIPPSAPTPPPQEEEADHDARAQSEDEQSDEVIDYALDPEREEGVESGSDDEDVVVIEAQPDEEEPQEPSLAPAALAPFEYDDGSLDLANDLADIDDPEASEKGLQATVQEEKKAASVVLQNAPSTSTTVSEVLTEEPESIDADPSSPRPPPKSSGIGSASSFGRALSFHHHGHSHGSAASSRLPSRRNTSASLVSVKDTSSSSAAAAATGPNSTPQRPPQSPAASVSLTPTAGSSSSATQQTSPVTRSQCRYQVLQLPGSSSAPNISFLFVAPQCCLANRKAIDEEGARVLREATDEENERRIELEEAGGIDEEVEQCLSRIVGIDLVNEGSVFYLGTVATDGGRGRTDETAVDRHQQQQPRSSSSSMTAARAASPAAAVKAPLSKASSPSKRKLAADNDDAPYRPSSGGASAAKRQQKARAFAVAENSDVDDGEAPNSSPTKAPSSSRNAATKLRSSGGEGKGKGKEKEKAPESVRQAKNKRSREDEDVEKSRTTSLVAAQEAEETTSASADAVGQTNKRARTEEEEGEAAPPPSTPSRWKFWAKR